MKAKVGYSVEANSFQSGVETVTKASEGMVPKVGLLFTSCVLDQNEIVKGIRSVSNVPFVGCTSSAGIVVSDHGYIDNADGYSGMMCFGGDNLVVGVAGSERDGDPREIGKKIAREAIKNAGINKVPSYFFMTASPKEEEEYLLGIQDVIGRVPMFGGSAADNTVEGKWSIICNDKVFSDGCAVAFFYADNECKTNYTGAYRETDHVGVITEVRNHRTLVSIDGVSALKKYADWIGSTPDALKGNNLLSASITKPLGVKDPIGNLIAIRHPMFGDDQGTADSNDDVMNLGNHLVKNTAIIQMEATIDELIHSNYVVLDELSHMMKHDPAAYLLIHCGGRRLGIAMEKREHEIYDELMKAANGKPFIVAFTFGEYGYKEHSANTCGGLSLSFTAFSK